MMKNLPLLFSSPQDQNVFDILSPILWIAQYSIIIISK